MQQQPQVIFRYTGSEPIPINTTHLYCENQKLTNLPELQGLPSLVQLYCFNNQLTVLPKLPITLIDLYCSKNQLTELPEFQRLGSAQTEPLDHHLYNYFVQIIN